MIPKIIHQVWDSCKEPLPDFYKQLAETWKDYHPDWRYEFWDGDRMEAFVRDNYPHLTDTYFNFKYSVQRWDVIRYLILYKMGGMYVDFDYECLESFDDYVIDERKCYFAMEPEDHCINFFGYDAFNNALMASSPYHHFFKRIIDHIFIESKYEYTNNKVRDVHATTGPVMLTELYRDYFSKDDILLWPEELVSPWSKIEVRSFMSGIADKLYLEKKLEKAIAIHYFFSLWA